MKFLALGKKEILALNNWRVREIRISQLHRLMHLRQSRSLKLSKKQINLFMQTKLKY